MEYIKKADLLARYEEARKGPAISLRKLIEEAETADLPPRRSPLKSDKTEEYLKDLGWKPKRKRYQTLTPEEIVSLACGDYELGSRDPAWCTVEVDGEVDGEDYENAVCGRTGAKCCESGGTACRDCLRAWLEEEV